MTLVTLYNSSSTLRNHATMAFVVSLAVSDFLYCAFNIPYYIIERLIKSEPFTNEKCTPWLFFTYFNVGCSILFLTAITINR